MGAPLQQMKCSFTAIPSTLQPSPPTRVSEPCRKRSCTVWLAALGGNFAVVVIYWPFELLVQAGRVPSTGLTMGLPKLPSITSLYPLDVNVPPAAIQSWNCATGLVPILISSTPPSKPASKLNLCRNFSVCAAAGAGTTNAGESRLLSLDVEGSLAKTAFGGVSGPEVVVTQAGSDGGTVVVVQPAGRAGAVTLSKFWPKSANAVPSVKL